MGNVLKRFNGSKWEAVGGTVSGDTLPIGSIVEYGGNVDPSNWLICDGRAISRLLYADLFNAIGTTYGEGDGSTTFNIPDYRGKGPVGLNSNDTDFNAMGKTGGEKTHTLTINEIPSHDHSVNASTAVAATGTDVRTVTSESAADTYWNNGTKTTGGGQAHNNMQPYIVQNFIIKAYQSVGVVGSISNIKNNATDATYSCDYVNKTLKPQYMNGMVTTNTTVQSNKGNTIPFKKIENHSDCFSMSDDYSHIIIGKGVTHIEFSATIMPTSNGNNYGELVLTRNNDNSNVQGGQWLVYTENFTAYTIAPIIIEVQEGDLLGILVNRDAAASVSFRQNVTNFKIKKID